MTWQGNDTSTLREAKVWLRGELDGGAKCPCCTQLAKVYRRKLNAGMARSLLRMYNAGGIEWVDVPTVCVGSSREEGKLRYWGLVEEDDTPREDGGHAGQWRVTPAGRAFILGDLTVQSHAKVYDSRCLGLEGPQVTIIDCLGKRFNLAELMATRAA